jgi:cytochrome c biogenesis protein CcmG/thiol:disulfide interchange protein DsbE
MFKVWFLILVILAGQPYSSGLEVPESIDRAPKVAPEFSRTDLAGRNISLKRYRGKVVLLNFWATWCASCRVELPKFSEWQSKYAGEGLQVVAVSMDDSAAPVRRVARGMQLEFPIVMGDARLGEAYGGVLGLPVTFLIDRHGRVVGRFKGDPDLSVMELHVKDLLAAH